MAIPGFAFNISNLLRHARNTADHFQIAINMPRKNRPKSGLRLRKPIKNCDRVQKQTISFWFASVSGAYFQPTSKYFTHDNPPLMEKGKRKGMLPKFQPKEKTYYVKNLTLIPDIRSPNLLLAGKSNKISKQRK
jgi:hypothetical protein